MQPTTLLLMVICLYGGTHAQIDRRELHISRINLNTDIPATPLQVCFTVAPDDAPVGTKFVLYIGTIETDISKGTEYPIEDEYSVPDKETTQVCLYSSNAFVAFPNKKIFFALQGENGNLVVEGIEYIQLSAFPADITSQTVGSPASAIRIKDDLSSWKICDSSDIDGGTSNFDPFDLHCNTDGGGPCYAVNIDATKSFAVCELTEDNDIPVLVSPIKPGTPATNEATKPTSIILDYKTGALNIVATKTPSKEALVYTDDENNVVICKDVTTCVLKNPYTPVDISLNVMLVTTENDEAKKSHEEIFKDFNLQVYPLQDTVLEARWTHGVDKYTAVRTKTAGFGTDESFHTVDVDCTNNNGFCYAYYVNLKKANTYTVEITPKTSDGSAENNLNKIISAPTPMSSLRSPGIIDNSLKNITIEKEYKKDSGTLELDICFTPDSTNGLNNTQLEVILISTTKQWKRVLEESKHQVEHRCYSTSFLLKSDTDSYPLLTALFIQREVNSNEVLSFHKSDLNLSAQKVVVPEVDNSSKGYMSTLAIVGAALGGITCLMALVAAAIMFVMKRKRINDGLQYPLHRTNIQDSNIILGLDSPYPTM